MKGVPKELDQIVDQVLAYTPPTSEARPTDDAPTVSVQAWSTPVDDMFSNGDARLDATHFDPVAERAIQKLQESRVTLQPLSTLADVELKSQFARIWSKDRHHGLPYLNATDLLSLLALGVPAGGPRYLSHATNTHIEGLVIREGWLLMTCSGTIGRVFYVPPRLAGWAATHDLIRIIPKDRRTTGYLYAWLNTSVAQSQILSHTHGGQIDHVTDDQVSDVLVPILSKPKIKKINSEVMKALRARERAISSLTNAWLA